MTTLRATMSSGSVEVGARTVTRPQVEDWLFAEADLLDGWDYDAWLGLFEPGARYEIPTTDHRGWSAFESGSFVCDDWDLIQARVKRLKSRKAHAENPHSRTHRIVGNVRLFPDGDSADSLRVTASFIVHRARDGQFDTYVGRYEHILVPDDVLTANSAVTSVPTANAANVAVTSAPTAKVAAASGDVPTTDGAVSTSVRALDGGLMAGAGGFRFRLRRCILGHEALGPGARLSFIL